MTVLVCGGRDYNEPWRVSVVLGGLNPTRIVHGGAFGADALAFEWAISNGVETKAYRPEWERDGPSAGPRRNQRMLDEEPDIALVVAFPGGKGTADMVRRAKAKKLPVVFA